MLSQQESINTEWLWPVSPLFILQGSVGTPIFVMIANQSLHINAKWCARCTRASQYHTKLLHKIYTSINQHSIYFFVIDFVLFFCFPCNRRLEISFGIFKTAPLLLNKIKDTPSTSDKSHQLFPQQRNNRMAFNVACFCETCSNVFTIHNLISHTFHLSNHQVGLPLESLRVSTKVLFSGLLTHKCTVMVCPLQ